MKGEKFMEYLVKGLQPDGVIPLCSGNQCTGGTIFAICTGALCTGTLCSPHGPSCPARWVGCCNGHSRLLF